MIAKISVCLISDYNRIAQALSFCQQVRSIGYQDRICLLLLEPVSRFYCRSLSTLNIDTKEIDRQLWPNQLPRVGLKMWLPLYFESDNYILLDSDLIILSVNFFQVFTPDHKRLKLVQESELVWQSGKKGILSGFHDSLIGRPILQTGAISFCHSIWQSVFSDLVKYTENDPSEFGDMAAINMFLHENPHLLEPLPEESCLVLRQTAKGPGSQAHLPLISVDHQKLLYNNKQILAIHYTNSGGSICHYEDILACVKKHKSEFKKELM